jgi:regulator of protease activity HflC (stomatin/prohibitin superfamily)
MKRNEFNFNSFKLNGFIMLFFQILILPSLLFLMWSSVQSLCNFALVATVATAILLSILWLIFWFGFMTLEPNEARVMVFFGTYKGTLKKTGFFWVNPFYSKKKLSLRARNLDIPPIKVNDQIGNPIMIGLVLVWKLSDTYKAMFDIDSQTMAKKKSGKKSDENSIEEAIVGRMTAFENFVKVQSDAALRQVAGLYAYDDNEGGHQEVTLRSGNDEVNEQLLEQLNKRLSMAGIQIEEARINYLAYAPEIAAVMLRRQQASAIISAREKIVEGAVSMVQMALDKLDQDHRVEMDKAQRAAMVSNLLVVLCGDEAPQPVVNTGTGA